MGRSHGCADCVTLPAARASRCDRKKTRMRASNLFPVITGPTHRTAQCDMTPAFSFYVER
jgi:hypothetical protein